MASLLGWPLMISDYLILRRCMQVLRGGEDLVRRASFVLSTEKATVVT